MSFIVPNLIALLLIALSLLPPCFLLLIVSTHPKPKVLQCSGYTRALPDLPTSTLAADLREPVAGPFS